MDFLILVILGTQDKVFPRLLEIVDKEIEISKEILDEFAKRLCTSLEPYLCDQPVEIDCNAAQKGLYNDGYEHFKRNLR